MAPCRRSFVASSRAEAGDETLARFRNKERVSAGLLGPVRIRVERPAAGDG